MKIKIHSNIKQFLKFSIVGLSNTIISFVITYGIIFSISYVSQNIEPSNPILVFIASVVAFIVSVLNSYYWNNKYVFKKTYIGHLKPILKSYVCYGTIFILSYILNAFVFTKLLNLSHLVIPILQIFICTPLNFISNKMWAFK